MLKQYQKGGQANINSKLDGNKLSVPSGNKSRKSSGNKNFLGKKRPRSEGSTSPSGDRHGSKDKNSANSKQGKKPGKNSGAIGTSKSLTGNKPVSLESNLGKSPKSNTIIPRVPNGVTYGAGGVAGTALTAGGIELVANKRFHRSIIDKIRYGITVQGVIDYFEKNTRFVTKKVDGQDVALLELDLKNNKKMFVHAYAVPYNNMPEKFSVEHKAFFKDGDENVQSSNLKAGTCFLTQYKYDSLAGYGELKDAFDQPLSFVVDYTNALCQLTYSNTEDDLKGSVFEGLDFNEEYGYLQAAIKPHIEKLVSKLKIDYPDLKVVKFKVVEQPVN